MQHHPHSHVLTQDTKVSDKSHMRRQMDANLAEGDFSCATCNAVLFSSTHQQNRRIDWPSFSKPKNEVALCYEADLSFGLKRTAVKCATCDTAIGHVFPLLRAGRGRQFFINPFRIVFKLSAR